MPRFRGTCRRSRSRRRRRPPLKAAREACLELGVLGRVTRGGKARGGTIGGARSAAIAIATAAADSRNGAIPDSFVGVPSQLLQALTQPVQAVPGALAGEALSPALVELLEAEVDVVGDVQSAHCSLQTAHNFPQVALDEAAVGGGAGHTGRLHAPVAFRGRPTYRAWEGESEEDRERERE